MHIDEHVHANMPELAKGYFPSAVPGRSEDITQYNDQYKKNEKIQTINKTIKELETDNKKVTKNTKPIHTK